MEGKAARAASLGKLPRPPALEELLRAIEGGGGQTSGPEALS